MLLPTQHERVGLLQAQGRVRGLAAAGSMAAVCLAGWLAVHCLQVQRPHNEVRRVAGVMG